MTKESVSARCGGMTACCYTCTALCSHLPRMAETGLCCCHLERKVERLLQQRPTIVCPGAGQWLATLAHAARGASAVDRTPHTHRLCRHILRGLCLPRA